MSGTGENTRMGADGETVGRLVAETRKVLRPLLGNGETEAVIGLLFHLYKNWGRVDLITHEGDTASDWLRSSVSSAVRRIVAGEPVQYVTGEAYFHGLWLKVTPDVLIPRPETSELIDIITDANTGSDLRVLDIGTGSGAIAMALARTLPFSEVTALDISSGALKVAQENARNLKVNVRFVDADIFNWEPEPDSFDIIVSNPPYVCESEKAGMEPTVLDFEPGIALFVPDSDPLKFYRRILEVGRTGLVAGGKIYFEINPLHADSLRGLMESSGYHDVTLVRDIHGKERFATGVRDN